MQGKKRQRKKGEATVGLFSCFSPVSSKQSTCSCPLCEQHPSLQTSLYCAAICRFKNSLHSISRNAFMVLLNKKNNPILFHILL